MKSFGELLLEAYNEPDPNPYLFAVGQSVRVKSGLWKDGQTHRAWCGAIVKVVGRHCTGLHKEHWYRLELPSGVTDDFFEHEIDRRYARVKS